LLGSFKALLESFVRMHDEPIPEHLDVDMVVDFLERLYLCPHYVVRATVACTLAPRSLQTTKALV
jgi:hypothetical protein